MLSLETISHVHSVHIPDTPHSRSVCTRQTSFKVAESAACDLELSALLAGRHDARSHRQRRTCSAGPPTAAHCRPSGWPHGSPASACGVPVLDVCTSCSSRECAPIIAILPSATLIVKNGHECRALPGGLPVALLTLTLFAVPNERHRCAAHLATALGANRCRHVGL